MCLTEFIYMLVGYRLMSIVFFFLRCLDYINRLLDILIENPNIVVGDNISEESEQLVNQPYRVKGCCLTVVERMDEEFTKMLQVLNYFFYCLFFFLFDCKRNFFLFIRELLISEMSVI